MKVALWLALSQVLHGTVDGFSVPQHVLHTGAWSRGSTSRFRPLFAEEESKGTENKQSELPKVPMPPPTIPELEAFDEKIGGKDVGADQQSGDFEPLRVSVKEAKPKVQLSPDDQKLVAASGVGFAFLGLIVGSIIIFEFPDLDVVMEPIVWPLATSIVFAIAGVFVGAAEGTPGEIVRGSVGKATSAVGNEISSAIVAAAGALIETVKNKVKQTTEEIKAIPSKVATAAKEKVEDAVEEISQIPTKVKDAAIETAENVKQRTIEKAEEVVEEIKATPGRVVESSRKAVSDAVDDTLDAVEKVVEEVASIPKKAVESVEETVNNLVGTKKPASPQPPKIPPPMAEGKPEKPKIPPSLPDLPTPSVPKLEIPKVEAPKITLPSVAPPKIEVPKLQVPKVSLPKIEPPKPVVKRTVEPQAIKEVKPKTKDAASEILDIQFAVRKATEETRRETLERQKQSDQRQSVTQADKEDAQKAANAKKEAASKAFEAKRQRETEIVQKKAAAEEEKRKREQDIAKRNAEREAAAAQAKSKQKAQKKKQAKAAEKSLQSAAPRRTISLGSLFSIGKSEDETGATPQPIDTIQAQAPPGVATLSNWKQNGDGSITGKITGSPSFKEGESVTTSPVALGASSGSVVRTSSGSRYFLGQKGGFSFAFLAPKVEVPKVDLSKPSELDKAAKSKLAQATELRRKTAEETKAKQEALAEERRKVAEETKAKQVAAAEASRKAAEEMKAKQAALAEERRKAAEEKKAAQAAAAEERRKAAEAKKAAQAAALEQQKAARLAADEQRRKAAEKSRLASNQSATEESRPTLSLSKIAPSTSQATPKLVKPPRGIPEIREWKKRFDGGINGRIYGSASFTEGDFVETSTITNGSIKNGSVVSTSSGSRYFLSAEPAVKKANIAAAVKDMQGAKPGATITLTGRQAAATAEAAKSGKPRATISLFGLGFGGADEGLPKPAAQRPSRPIPAKQAPRGIPTMSRWKKNFDGSVTGLISGSKAFTDGDRVTTSPIVSGKIARGEVVTTGSGSKYFLS